MIWQPFVFFHNEEIFVQLDELDETTDAWIRAYLKVPTATMCLWCNG